MALLRKYMRRKDETHDVSLLIYSITVHCSRLAGLRFAEVMKISSLSPRAPLSLLLLQLRSLGISIKRNNILRPKGVVLGIHEDMLPSVAQGASHLCGV